MIAVKDRKSISFFKLEPFISTGSTNDFLLFDPFIVSVFVQHVWTKAVTSHLFTPLFMFIHLPLIHFVPPPRLLIDFKNSSLRASSVALINPTFYGDTFVTDTR